MGLARRLRQIQRTATASASYALWYTVLYAAFLILIYLVFICFSAAPSFGLESTHFAPHKNTCNSESTNFFIYPNSDRPTYYLSLFSIYAAHLLVIL